jgi:dipeptidyl aminopeptidase/acylaminoacyl peptidase
MSVTAPPRPPRSSDPVDRDELEALIEALIEEARQRARRRRRRNGAYALLALVLGTGAYAGIVHAVPQGGSAATASTHPTPAGTRAKVRNGPITLFVGAANGNAAGAAGIETVGQAESKVIWQCPGKVFCGQPVSFAWAPDGKRVAFSLDEIGGQSTYVGLHVVNVVSGHDAQIPPGPPKTMSDGAWAPYLGKMNDRVGCWPATDLAWSPDGSSLAYRCDKVGINSNGSQGRPHINVLTLSGSGHTTVRTSTLAFWPSWSPDGTRLAYATSLLRPTKKTEVYTIALDGSHRRLVATGGTAPAWSPDRRRIAYQARCGIRLVTPAGKDVTPAVNSCGAIGRSAPPMWSPDGTKLAFETKAGVYVMGANGSDLHRVSLEATTTWYGALPGRPSWRPVP